MLGALFTCVQAYEYAHAAFAFKGNIYGATFFMATGFHGAHVLIGTIFLIVCLVRASTGHFTPTAASRLRVRRLVLALRRRGVAVPVRLHLCVGRRRRTPAPARIERRHDRLATKGRRHSRPFRFETRMSASTNDAPISPPITRGLRCRCPRCGKGRCSTAFSIAAAALRKLRARLSASPMPATGRRCSSSCSPASSWCSPRLIVEVLYRPPFWLHAVLWLPLILLTTLAPLRADQGPADRAAVPPQGGGRALGQSGAGP